MKPTPRRLTTLLALIAASGCVGIVGGVDVPNPEDAGTGDSTVRESDTGVDSSSGKDSGSGSGSGSRSGTGSGSSSSSGSSSASGSGASTGSGASSGSGSGSSSGSGSAANSGGDAGDAGGCVLAATRCSGNGVQTCGSNGQWGNAVECASYQTCMTTTCVGEPSDASLVPDGYVCGPGSCGGCCSTTGDCLGGYSVATCGVSGQGCKDCTSSGACSQGSCTTPAPDAAPPMCEAASCSGSHCASTPIQSACCKSDHTCGCQWTVFAPCQ
jgi:hypothetical protein